MSERDVQEGASSLHLHPCIILWRLCRRCFSRTSDPAEVDETADKLGRPIPLQRRTQWEAWLADLPGLAEVTLPRCYRPDGFGEIVSAHLHHF